MKNILRYTLLFVLSSAFLPQYLYAQRRVNIKGKVTDAKTHQPIPLVNVRNINKETSTITDSTGQYNITAKNYDRIVFSYIGYTSDTIRVNALYQNQIIDIQMKEQKYSFAPVDIIGSRPNYRRDSLERRKWFSSALNENKTNGWGAVEHPISALFDAISGKRKRLWRFQKDYKAYEQQKYIASRIQRNKIKKLFDLKGDSLTAFLIWYKPNYYFVRNATDYELLVDLKKAVKRFRKVYVMKPDQDFEDVHYR